jgi:hypothetical protein
MYPLFVGRVKPVAQLAGSTAARGGRDLALPKPSKGATLCPQHPEIWGTSVEIRRCQDSLMRHQREIADTPTSATFVTCRIPRSNYLGVREGAA